MSFTDGAQSDMQIYEKIAEMILRSYIFVAAQIAL